MLNPYTLNIQESLNHAWHWVGYWFFEVLSNESVKFKTISRKNFANRVKDIFAMLKTRDCSMIYM